MTAIRRVVVAALLTVWCFPALSLAKPAPIDPAPLFQRASATAPSAADETAGSETENLTKREQKARELQDFKGGGVYIYLGSGVLLVIIVILVILLV